MFYNEDYPWYLQDSPVFSKLYDGIYEVAKNISPLDIWKLFYITELSGSNIKLHAALWGLSGEWSGVRDALNYNIDSWGNLEEGTGKYWSGIQGLVDDEWYRRYVLMKIYIQNKPFSYTLIKDALDVLLGNIYKEVSVTEETMVCNINIQTDSEVSSILRGILSYDPDMLGKPTGIKVNYNFI